MADRAALKASMMSITSKSKNSASSSIGKNTPSAFAKPTPS